jgi:type I restriction-modification system DNA methylase subunit
MEKEPESQSAWKALSRLFKAISNGDREIGMPQYNGALFEMDKEIDRLDISNKYLVPALRALLEIDGKGIDYQNLGVRHLGSLYESLLEYSVKQASTELAVIKGEYIDMSFTKDLKARYDSIVDKGDLYLSAGGLARKGTGSYYTPDKIVRFLVKKGLEPIFADREKKFLEGLEKWRKTGDGAELLTKQLLDIRVVDPAMGSGHFLVATVNEIAMWIAGLLDRHPDAPLAKEIGEDRQRIIDEQAANGIEIDTELLTFNIILKRMVMKRCVYGVDINPLAVELAKLSLWLDSFTIGTPLTFLDHHVRAGDSLIGLWVGDLKSKRPDNATLDEWTGSIDLMGDVMRTVSYPADLNVEEVKRSKENYMQGRKASKPLRTLLSMKAAGIIDEELDKKMPRNLPMVVEAVRNDKLDRLVGGEPVKKAIEYSEKYQFFHWEFEFPDAFMDEREGFDLVVMNPPWEAVKPEDDDFFSGYLPKFRRLKSKPEKEREKQKLLKEKAIATEFQDYVERIEDRVKFYKLSEQYVKRGGGDTDLWKLFLERSFSLLASEGTLSLVLPSGIVTNEGAKELRKELLERKIQCLYEFENKNGIFADVHRSYKFALVICTNTPSAAGFPAAFYLHDVAALDGKIEQSKFVKISSEFVKLVSPDSLTIPEIRAEKEREIFEKLYMNHPLLSEGVDNGRWTFAFVTEMHRTASSHLFRQDGRGWQLIEGKHFHQFIHDYEKPTFTVKPEEGLKWTERIREYGVLNKQIHEIPRLVFRNVAASTNVRSIISAIIPPNTFLPHSASVVVPRYKNELLLSMEYFKIISYILGLFNSLIFDFLIRRRVTMNLSFFYLKQTPIPEKIQSTVGQRIIKLSARLNAPNRKFEDLTNSTGVDHGTLGMKDRVELTAKLDALVAYHYGLTRPEYEYIINTFEGFEEDENLVNLTEVIWDDRLIRKFNGEVRKRVLKYYDEIAAEMKGEKNG